MLITDHPIPCLGVANSANVSQHPVLYASVQWLDHNRLEWHDLHDASEHFHVTLRERHATMTKKRLKGFIPPESSEIKARHGIPRFRIRLALSHMQWRVFTPYNREAEHIPIKVKILQHPSMVEYEVVFAVAILLAMYILIGFDLSHKTVAAFFGSFLGVALVSALHEQPQLEEVISWIDFETVCLLFGMMVIVAVFSRTGFFEAAAVQCY
eukprot:gene4970-2376_t